MAIFVEHILKAFNFDFTQTQLVRHGTITEGVWENCVQGL